MILSSPIPSSFFMRVIKDVIIHSVEAWAIPGLMNWNNLELLASETRKAH
jgi:hypothetical protein